MISAFHYESDGDLDSGDLEASVLDQYTAFEMLSPNEKFKKYVESHNVFERQAAGRLLCDAVDSCETKEEFRSTMVYISRLSVDPEPTVRVELMERIPELARICIERSEQLSLSSSMVEEEILPLVINYLEDLTNTVRKTAQTSLVAILEFFSPQVCHQKILPNIIGLAEKQNDDYRTEAVTLLAKLSPILGEEITRDEVLPKFLTACNDELFHVRKVSATHAPDIAKVIGPYETELNIVPHFAKLSEDVVWGVRKACADSFASLAEAVSDESRINTLSPLFVDLLNDDSRWVRLSAYQELGKFIASFAKSELDLTTTISEVEEEAKEFNTAAFWKADLPDVNFDLELEPDEDSDPEDEIQASNSSVEDATESKLPEADQQMELLPAEGSGDTVDTPLVAALGDAMKEQLVFGDDGDDEVPVNYAEQHFDVQDGSLIKYFLSIETPGQPGEEAGDGGTDPYNADQIDSDEVKIRISNNECDDDELVDDLNRSLDRFNDDEANQSMERLSHSSFLSVKSHDSDENLPQTEPKLEPQNVIPEVLLKYYLSMTVPKRQTEFHDSELARHCAYSIPGVALTLGKRNWKCLRDIYTILAQDVQWKVRRTLAASIHEIAQILGEKMASEELVTIFNSFLNDLDEVRIGLLKNISDFLSLVNKDARMSYLTQMVEFLTTDNVRNWRFRLTLAYQMSKVIRLYTPDEVAQHHTNIVTDLLQDKIASVRLQGAHLAASITGHLIKSDNKKLHQGFVHKMTSFSISEDNQPGQKWLHRSVFCYYANCLIDPISVPFPAEEDSEGGVDVEMRDDKPYVCDAFFEEFILPEVLRLSHDPIVNVRLCAARCLRNLLLARPYFKDINLIVGKQIDTTMKRLAMDLDRDVQFIADDWREEDDDDDFDGPISADQLQRIEDSLPNGELSYCDGNIRSSSPAEGFEDGFNSDPETDMQSLDQSSEGSSESSAEKLKKGLVDFDLD